MFAFLLRQLDYDAEGLMIPAFADHSMWYSGCQSMRA